MDNIIDGRKALRQNILLFFNQFRQYDKDIYYGNVLKIKIRTNITFSLDVFPPV